MDLSLKERVVAMEIGIKILLDDNFFRKGTVKFEGTQTCNKLTRHAPGTVFPSESIFFLHSAIML